MYDWHLILLCFFIQHIFCFVELLSLALFMLCVFCDLVISWYTFACFCWNKKEVVLSRRPVWRPVLSPPLGLTQRGLPRLVLLFIFFILLLFYVTWLLLFYVISLLSPFSWTFSCSCSLTFSGSFSFNWGKGHSFLDLISKGTKVTQNFLAVYGRHFKTYFYLITYF